MNRKTTTSVLLITLVALLSATAALADIQVIELSPTHIGHMVYNYYAQPNADTPEPYYTSNPGSTLNWGENRTYSAEYGTDFVQEWRAFMNFPITPYLQGRVKVLRAEFYYGVGTFVNGGPGLPEFYEIDLWTGSYDEDLGDSVWDNGGNHGNHMFGIHPVSTWIPLSQIAIDRMTPWAYDWGVSIHDASHASEDGFYGAMARRCKLRLTIQFPDLQDSWTNNKDASTNTDMTFGDIKSLYK